MPGCPGGLEADHGHRAGCRRARVGELAVLPDRRQLRLQPGRPAGRPLRDVRRGRQRRRFPGCAGRRQPGRRAAQAQHPLAGVPAQPTLAGTAQSDRRRQRQQPRHRIRPAQRSRRAYAAGQRLPPGFAEYSQTGGQPPAGRRRYRRHARLPVSLSGGAAGPARPRLPRFPPDGGSRSGTRAHPGEDVAPGLPLRRAPGQRGNQPRRKTPGASAEPVEVCRDHRRQVFLRLPGPVQRGTLRPGRAGQRHAAQGGDGRELRQSHPGDRGNCRQPDRRNLAQPGGGAPVQQRRRLLAGWFRHPRNRKYQWRQRQQVAGAIAQRAAGDSSAGQRNIFQWLARCGDHPSIQLRWQRPDRPDYHQRRRTGGAQRTVRRLPGALAGHSVQCPRPCRALRLRGGPRPTDQQGRRQRPGRELSLRRFRPGNPAPLRRR
ncbi:Uncharacterised protein [Klebsiella pneumoniae]|nr:Uncharacterised protein [Klebsiella pneumoniae]